MSNSSKEIETLADDLLALIRLTPSKPFKLPFLLKKLKAEQGEINEAIDFLASCDYRLKKRRDSVTFVSAPDLLTATEIGYKLKTRLIGRSIAAYKTARSTNDIASQMANDGASEGTIVTSERQTSGRGRMGRAWYSPSGTGIYLSIILRPKIQPLCAPGLSIMTALALAETLELYCPGEVQIKWPNDLLIGGRKVAGILTELSAESKRTLHVVVGVGVNVNQGAGTFPEDIRKSATSIRRAIKRKVNRVTLLQQFLVRFEKEYGKYLKSGLKNSRARLRRYSSLIGTAVVVRSGKDTIKGRAIDIDADGRLILKTETGEKLSIVAGEVTIIKGGR